MVVDKLGTEKFSVNFCLLLFTVICSCLQLFAGADTRGVHKSKACSQLFAAVRGCSRLLTIFVIKFIFSQSQTPINDLSYVY